MRKLLVGPECCASGETRKSRFEYEILIDEMQVPGGFSCESYGVNVTDRLSGVSAAIPNITVSVSRIDELMELLIRGQVGPTSLRDVIDDWL